MVASSHLTSGLCGGGRFLHTQQPCTAAEPGVVQAGEWQWKLTTWRCTASQALSVLSVFSQVDKKARAHQHVETRSTGTDQEFSVLQGYLAHKKLPPPFKDHRRAQGIVLL